MSYNFSQLGSQHPGLPTSFQHIRYASFKVVSIYVRHPLLKDMPGCNHFSTSNVNLLRPASHCELGRLGKSPLPASKIPLKIIYAWEAFFAGVHLHRNTNIIKKLEDVEMTNSQPLSLAQYQAYRPMFPLIWSQPH